jgi:hypothetical protein
VPDEAVIRSGKRNLAVVALGDGRFEPREIELGLDSGDGWLEVKSGLEENDVIVTSGQFLIDSESKLKDAVQSLLSAGKSPAGEPEHAASDTLDRGEADLHAGHAMDMEAPDDPAAKRGGADAHSAHDHGIPSQE